MISAVTGKSGRDLLIPQVQYYTNDAWEDGQCRSSADGWSFGLSYSVESSRMLPVICMYLTIPDDMGNLYDFPANALNEIRRIMSKDIGCLSGSSLQSRPVCI